jgi:hypothetical protein
MYLKLHTFAANPRGLKPGVNKTAFSTPHKKQTHRWVYLLGCLKFKDLRVLFLGASFGPNFGADLSNTLISGYLLLLQICQGCVADCTKSQICFLSLLDSIHKQFAKTSRQNGTATIQRARGPQTSPELH